MRWWIVVVSYAVCMIYPAKCGKGTSVMIEDVWGTLSLQAGPDPREIICTVINPSPNGEMVWMIGDEVQTNNNPVETNDYGDWQQSFNLVPTVGIDDKRFRCLYVERDPSTNELLSDYEDEDFITLDIAWYDFPEGVQEAGSYPPDLPITLEVEFGLYPMPEGPGAVIWEITDNQGNVLRLEPEQTDPPYSTGALSTEGLEENKYRASLFIDTLNNDPIKEMNKTHELVVTASDDVLVRVPVKFRMQEPEVGSQDQGGVDEPTVTETTVKPDDDPKMLSVGMFIIMAIVILIILVCIGYCVYQQCFSKKENTNANGTAGGQGGYPGSAGNKTGYTEVPKKDEEANLT